MKEIDKSKWDKGPWMHEPDYMFGDIDGYKSLILRQKMGHLCGYVCIHENSPLYGKEYYQMK